MLSSTKAVHLNYHDLNDVLNQPETEHNWAAKENALKSLGNACHSSIAQNHEFVSFMKNHRKAFAECLLTERTRLSGSACELVEKLSTAMGRDFGLHFPELFTSPLLKVCARTNKVMVTRSVKALNSMINAGCITTLPKACQAFTTNNKMLRIACIGLVASCIAQFSSQELEPFLASFEPVLKEGVSDAAPEVRDTSRKSFKIYAEKFPDRAQMMTTTLPSNVLKYLLPDSRPASSPQSRTTTPTPGRPAPGRLDDGRFQSSRELTAAMNRAGPSRVGPVRARTMAVAEHSPATSSFKVPTVPASHASQSAQPYSLSQQTSSSSAQSHSSLSRIHGLANRTSTFADTTENNGHGLLRSSSQRARSSFSGTSVQRTPSINLATNGGPQRVTSSYNADTAKLTRSASTVSRGSKAEPVSKSGRTSAPPNHSNQGAGARRSITDYSGYGSFSSASSTPSTATSTTTVSPASSSSTSPTTQAPPNHDALFSTFRAPVGSQLNAGSRGAGHVPSTYAPPSPSHEGVELGKQVNEFGELYRDDDNDDLNMSFPDHESLFGVTEEYLEVEREIAEIQQSLAKRTQVKPEAEEKRFMEEDSDLMDHEQLEVKAYAQEYEATLAAASCSSTSLPSSHEDE
ncbi:hypothetical protein BGX31_006323 [Mortierella sp. GBA43]|nr:hypothetical protein BGX31_006323 [Mortierella sp. GBA43]